MANYTTHKIFGIVGTIGIVGLAYSITNTNIIPEISNHSLLDMNIFTIIIMLIIGFLGSIFPDIDLKNSTISKNFTKSLYVIAPFLISSKLYLNIDSFEKYISNYSQITLISGIVLSSLIITYIINFLFFKTMKHRGLVHSILFGILSSIIVFELFTSLNTFSGNLLNPFLISIAFGGGFLIHLILDEFYSIDFLGFEIKSSSGTALTLFDKENIIGSIITIGLVVVYALINSNII